MGSSAQPSARLTKVLTIGNNQVTNIVNDNVKLGLFSTGRAMFTVVTDSEPKGLVELHIGYNIDQLTPYFLGVIESKHYSDGRWFITCRELLGALSFPTSIAIRFTTAKMVLDKLSELGISFVTPSAEYINKKVPCFYHNGTGLSVLQQIGKVFNIESYIFQQRPDGQVYVGSWHDSGWAKSEINDFAEHPIKVKNAIAGELIAIPKLRPGLKLNGRYIIDVVLSGNKQSIKWSKSLAA
ncbi:MAG: hypothetical protein COB83_08800 [Gammaproteobacteria bacterium]|nr:MAG: hypothetical protein COB83_08800 [Gammaproteobacteria bacterium]